MTLKNRDLEIKHLKIELESLGTCYKCEECEFTSNLEQDLKSHIESMHQHLCSHCSCSYVGDKKLKKHLCRIFLCNPSCPENDSTQKTGLKEISALECLILTLKQK